MLLDWEWAQVWCKYLPILLLMKRSLENLQMNDGLFFKA